jgi:hypothetical protein
MEILVSGTWRLVLDAKVECGDWFGVWWEVVCEEDGRERKSKSLGFCWS